ncbi:MAG: hypothetical protein KJ964_06985 [Verrucomicrobia bacterium]|nr:hypothetical protein [Verrucomicrobiota bacterium]MBU1735023.1 hypothetical protein [Verrucomicrobiota bacterium]MBU1856039.1 hypothetical protein [Verrucomicrobiota bacterium]
MFPKRDRQITLHLIANSHLDPVWFWRWQEGMNEIIPTCRTVLELLDEYPELKYTKGESLMYEYLQEHDPVAFRRVKEMVQAGRWEIIGGWYNQPDTVLCDGESLIRQAVYGQEYFKREFKIQPRIAYLVDSFGQAGGLPQILKKTGFAFFVFQRPRQSEMSIPSPLFRWKSNDGSEIMALRLIRGYTNESGMLKEKIELNLKEMPEYLNDWPVLFGLGDHGGGLSRNDIELILDLRAELKNDNINMTFSTLENFFRKASPAFESLPIFEGELLYHGRGCLSSNSRIKKQTWDLRRTLFNADFINAAAMSAGNKDVSQNAELTKCWKALLFNQFHDVICGTCSPEASEDSERQLSGGIFSAEREINGALLKLASFMDTEGRGQSVIAVNPHPWAVKMILPVEFQLDYRPLDKKPESYTVVDAGENTIQCQEISSTSVMGELQWRKKVIFKGELPPCGCSVFHIIPEAAAISPERAGVKVESGLASNGNITVFLDKKSGGIILSNAEENSLNLFAGQLHVFEDYSDTWAHDTDKFDNYKGRFEIQKSEWIETGSLRAVMRVTSKYNESVFVQDFEIISGRNDVVCQAELDWREKHAVAKLVFSTEKTINDLQVLRTGSWEKPRLESGELPNGVLLKARDAGNSFWCVSCPEKGAYDVKEHNLRLTIARSSIYAWYRAPLPQNAGYHEYLDTGRQKFSYTIIRPEKWSNPEWVHTAYENSMPPVTMLAYPHKGVLGKSCSLFKIDKPGLILWTANPHKHKKDGGIIFRFWNSRPEKTDYTITFSDKREIVISTKPEEIITVLWRKGKMPKLVLWPDIK